jgi:L-asparaginase/Glu-tRNA(Gln) amidotransferase subunit D
MTARFDINAIAKNYDFARRKKTLRNRYKKFHKERLLLIGFGGTISSGYSPVTETIVPLYQSQAVNTLSFINSLGVNHLKFDNLGLVAKDSRELTSEDLYDLLDALHASPNTSALITCGTYNLARVAEVVLRGCEGLDKIIGLTGSAMPAGYFNSDAGANILSALSIIDYAKKHKTGHGGRVLLVFHGKVYESLEEFRSVDLFSDKARAIS